MIFVNIINLIQVDNFGNKLVRQKILKWKKILI
jgi:hypothetical protein